MANEAFEYLTTWNKTAFEAIKKIADNNIRISEKLIQEQLGLAKSIAADSSKIMETISTAKDPQEIIKKQSAMAEETGKQIMKSARSCADILAEASQTYSKLCEENMEAANKATTSSTKKSA